MELDAAEILEKKISWEAFVAEARTSRPQVLATLSAYGSLELVHSLRLVLQWPDGRVEYARSFHLLDGNLEQLTEGVFKELASIGPNVKLVTVSQPLPVEHCPCCGSGFSRILKPAIVTRLIDPDWDTRSVCSIYINPGRPSIALLFSLGDRTVTTGALHLCHGEYLHYTNEGVDDRLPIRPKPSVRTQATAVVRHILREWAPAQLLIGTGDPDNPALISDLELPRVWERARGRTDAHRRMRGT